VSAERAGLSSRPAQFIRDDEDHHSSEESEVHSGDLSAEEAAELTTRIREGIETVWRLLHEAYARKAHVALGYQSWATYVHEEFHISRSRSYQLIDQGNVVFEIEAAAGVSTPVDINEATTRRIKPVLSVVTDNIRERIAAGELPDPVVADEIARAGRSRRGLNAELRAMGAPICGESSRSPRAPRRPAADRPNVCEFSPNGAIGQTSGEFFYQWVSMLADGAEHAIEHLDIDEVVGSQGFGDTLDDLDDTIRKLRQLSKRLHMARARQ
jgi:hypothetical protein